jgi:transcriptional regulator with XRE-family HTH domain
MMRQDVAHMIAIIRTAMRILGFKNADVERKLGWSTSYLSRLYSGGIELRFEHVLDISKALGLRTEELFRFAYPDRGEAPTEAALRLQEAAGSFQWLPQRPAPPPPPPPATTEADLDRLMARSLRKLLAQLEQG